MMRTRVLVSALVVIVAVLTVLVVPAWADGPNCVTSRSSSTALPLDEDELTAIRAAESHAPQLLDQRGGQSVGAKCTECGATGSDPTRVTHKSWCSSYQGTAGDTPSGASPANWYVVALSVVCVIFLIVLVSAAP